MLVSCPHGHQRSRGQVLVIPGVQGSRCPSHLNSLLSLTELVETDFLVQTHTILHLWPFGRILSMLPPCNIFIFLFSGNWNNKGVNFKVF